MPPDAHSPAGARLGGPGFDAPFARRRFLAATGVVALTGLAGAQGGSVRGSSPDGFSFVHISDSHLSPRPRSTPLSAGGRSMAQLRWIRERIERLIDGGRRDADAGPAPSFAIVTGDLLEYSTIDETWDDVERMYDAMPVPCKLVAGNHDNTWSTIGPMLRRRHGGDSHSFDRFGWHFVCLTSAGTLDPSPCFDARTLAWLERDLSGVDADTPIVIAMHHPLAGNSGYASEFDKLRLLELIAGRRVAFMLDGHWHVARRGSWATIDRFCGGTTFGKNAGFGVFTVAGGRLTARYRYFDRDRADDVLINEAWTSRRVPTVRVDVDRAEGGRLGVSARLRGAGVGDGVICRIDNAEGTDTVLTAAGDGMHRGVVASGDLEPGRHFAHVFVRRGEEGRGAQGSAEFTVPHDGRLMVRRWRAGASIKTRPTPVGDGAFVVADTSGVVTSLSVADLAVRWRHRLAECVHTLGVSGGTVIAGDTDGVLVGLDGATGAERWRISADVPWLAPPACVDGVAYIGDGGGSVHAIETGDGTVRWRRRVGDFGFEARPAVLGETIVVGSWDGRVYALRSDDGGAAWDAWGPMGQVGTKSRYYGPADSSPVALGDSVFVTDRGYRLGEYGIGGGFRRLLRERVSAISPTERRDGFFAKTLDDRLIRYGVDGGVVWEVAGLGGRVPTAPAQRGDLVALASDRGRITVVRARDGGEIATYRASPRLFLFAPPAWVGDRDVATADAGGTLTLISIDT